MSQLSQFYINTGGNGVESVVAGSGISVDNTDPKNPVVSNDGVLSVVAGAGVSVDNTDPQNPVVSATGGGGSYLGDVTKSVGSGGDFADLDELQTWMNANSGRLLTVDVLGEVASPSGVIPALTNQSFLQLALNGVSGSALNTTIFFGNVGLSGQFTVKGNLLFTKYYPNPFNVTATLSKNSSEIVEIYNCESVGGIIIYDGELKVTSSTFYALKAEKITMDNCDVYLCEAVTDTTLFLDLRGFNDIGTVDAKSYTIDYLMRKSRTSSTIGYVNNDTNVTNLLQDGTINVYDKNGYVVVGNK